MCVRVHLKDEQLLRYNKLDTLRRRRSRRRRRRKADRSVRQIYSGTRETRYAGCDHEAHTTRLGVVAGPPYTRIPKTTPHKHFKLIIYTRVFNVPPYSPPKLVAYILPVTWPPQLCTSACSPHHIILYYTGRLCCRKPANTMGISKSYIFFWTFKNITWMLCFLPCDYQTYLFLKCTDGKTITLYKVCKLTYLGRDGGS